MPSHRDGSIKAEFLCPSVLCCSFQAPTSHGNVLCFFPSIISAGCWGMGAWDISRSFSTGPCGRAGAPASAWNGPSGCPQMMPIRRRAAEVPPPPAPALPGCWLPQRRKQIVSKQAGTHADSFPSSWLQAASFRNKQRCDHLCCLNSLNCLLPRNAWRWLALGWHCLRCSYLSTSLWLQSGDGGGLAKNSGPCQGGRLLSRSTLVLIRPTHHHPVHSRLHCIASPTLEIEILAKCISLMLYARSPANSFPWLFLLPGLAYLLTYLHGWPRCMWSSLACPEKKRNIKALAELSYSSTKGDAWGPGNATWVFCCCPCLTLHARLLIEKLPTLGEGRIPDRTHFDARTTPHPAWALSHTSTPTRPGSGALVAPSPPAFLCFNFSACASVIHTYIPYFFIARILPSDPMINGDSVMKSTNLPSADEEAVRRGAAWRWRRCSEGHGSE